MNAFIAFTKKEWLETIRSGKLVILTVLFLLFGIMNPAIAKLTPWMMELMSESLSGTGLIVTQIQVDALVSWTQFFKNIPIALIAFILIYSGIFTREYQSGTLVLVLTKGLSRSKAVLAKTALMLAVWSFCYWLCFGVTYGYNMYFWDNKIACNLLAAVGCWWLFGVWIISLTVFFSTVFENTAGVLAGIGSTALAAYVLGIFPSVKEYTPAKLLNASILLTGATEPAAYGKAVILTVVLSAGAIVGGIALMNRRHI